MDAREPAAIYLVKITKSVSIAVQSFAACSSEMAERANQKLQALAALWEERRNGSGLPIRADLPPSLLRPWLGCLAIFELRPEKDPIFRLCGTSLHARFGGEMTGRPITDLQPDMAEPLRKELEFVIARRKPRRTRHISRGGLQLKMFEELFLPLADDRGDGNFVLFASYSEATE